MPLVDLGECRKTVFENTQKWAELCETVRMHSRFLFAGTAEGPLCRIFLLANFYDTHALTLTVS